MRIIGLLILCGLMLSLGLKAQDITGTNMTLTGTADIAGNALYLGTHSGSPSTSGLTLGFFDGSTTTIGFTASAASNLWQWQQNASGTLATQMSLSGSNTLALYNSTGTVVIALSPTGVSSISGSLTVGGTLTVSGTNNQMPNQTLVGANSVVTEGLGDARYLQLRSGGYIGIGTSTPVTQLQVGSGTGLDSSAVASFYGSTTAGGVISVGSSDASKQAEVGVDGTAGYLSTVSNQAIQFRPDNVTAMTITPTGSVGIGTTTPAARLNVVASGGPSQFNDNYYGTGGGNTTIVLRGARGTPSAPSANHAYDILGAIGVKGYGTTGFSTGNIASIVFRTDSTTYTDGSQPSEILFYTNPYSNGNGTNSIQRMMIKHDGQVGIGDGNPISLLTVKQQNGAYPITNLETFYTTSGTITSNTIVAQTAHGTQDSPTAVQKDDVLLALGVNPYGTTRFAGYNTVSGPGAGTGKISINAAENCTDSAQGSYISFKTTSNGTTYTSIAERMRIDQNGNVGIGTTTPSAPLEVNGAAKVGGAIIATGTITAAAGGDIPMYTGH